LTFKTAQEFTRVQNLVNPDYPLHINPYLALPQLHPPRLPHFQAVFSPAEQRDKHDLAESFLYTGALQRQEAFRFIRYLPLYQNTIGLATGATVDLLMLQAGQDHLPVMPIEGQPDWDTLVHPFDYHDLFHGDTPAQLLARAGHTANHVNPWAFHLHYLVSCRRMINQLMDTYENFFRVLGFRGFRDVFKQVSLNTVTGKHPCILTTDEAIYFTAAYDFFLREHSSPIARELLVLLNIPFRYEYDYQCIQTHILDEIIPPTDITVYDIDLDASDGEQDMEAEGDNDEQEI